MARMPRSCWPGVARFRLVVLAFEGDGRAARACFEQLRAMDVCKDAPVLAVFGPDCRSAPALLPAGFSDWLDASQIERELVARWAKVAHGQAAHAGAWRRSPAVAPEEALAYRFAFDDDDNEWLVVDPEGERVVDLNPAVLRYSQIPAGELLGKPISELLAFEGIELADVLRQADRQWHACQRRTRQGARYRPGQRAPRPPSRQGCGGAGLSQ